HQGRSYSVTRYCAHLRDMASARGGEEAAQAVRGLGQAQAALAEAKAAQLRSELVETDAVEKLWTSKPRAFRNRISSIPGRGQYLSQPVVFKRALPPSLKNLAGTREAGALPAVIRAELHVDDASPKAEAARFLL